MTGSISHPHITDSTPASNIKRLAPLIPYLTIGIGLLVFHNAWIAILTYHGGMVLAMAVSRNRIPIKHLFRSKSLTMPAATAVLGASGGILLYVLWPLLEIPLDISGYIRSIGLTEVTWPIFIVYFIVINPFLEEYFWRGYIGSEAKRPISNDFLFSGYHVLVLAGQMGPIWVMTIFVILAAGAWFWRQANRWSQGMLSSAISHAAADITVILAIYLLTT